VAALCYILLGFVISSQMFQLSCSLALVLNIIDIKESKGRTLSFNICVIIIALATSAVAFYQMVMNRYAQKQHLIMEVLGLFVMCLIYFSTCVELYRKLSIFVLEETKKEARLVQLQFLIFFLAYGSKIIVLMCWIKNPPEDRDYYESFLINTDIMALVWTILPVSFLLGMQIRSFRKMSLAKTQFISGVEDFKELDHPDCRLHSDSGSNSRLLTRSRDSDGSDVHRTSIFRRPWKISRNGVTSQGDASIMETMSQPGTTSSLGNYFENVNAITENQVAKEFVDEEQR